MTQKEIQQKAYEVYPLDLDRHMIIEGEPYDNNKEKREAYIRGLTDSQPELPSEKDLTLTWEDVAKIDAIIMDVNNEFAIDNSKEISRQKFYKEVLKRFNELKK